MTKRQEDFELKAHQAAINKIRAELNKLRAQRYLSSTIQGQRQVQNLTQLYSDGLRDYCAAVLNSRATTTAGALAARPFLEIYSQFVPWETIGVVVLKTLVDYHNLGGWVTQATVVNELTDRVEAEFRFYFYSQVLPKELVEHMTKRAADPDSTPKYRRNGTKFLTDNLIKRYEEQTGEVLPKWQPFTQTYRGKNGSSNAQVVGLFLLDIAARIGLIEKSTITNKNKKKTTRIKLHQSIAQAIKDEGLHIEAISYFRWPLIDPPLPWVNQPGISRKNRTGGYHTDHLRQQLPMSRGFDNRSHFEELSVQFLNTNGNTAWAVDHSILELCKTLKERGISVDSLNAYQRPDSLDDPMPQALVNLSRDHPNRVAWRVQRKREHQEHIKKAKKTIRVHRSIEMAEQTRRYPRFFLSWSYDYRGRCYSQQPWLSPHATSFEKALLRFADGKRLDELGEKQVLIALGAAYLGTSDTLDSRKEWAKANLDFISKIGAEPLSTVPEWEAAKDPWAFVQLCIEWYKVKVAKTQGLWYVPVQLDATCSGLQLLSGILRDPLGMQYSNVLPPKSPESPPEDAYMRVLEAARVLAQEAGEGHLLPFMQERGVGKTFMVMIYGAVLLTVAERIQEVLTDKGLLRKVVWDDKGQMQEIVDPNKCSFKDTYKISTYVIKAAKHCFPKAFQALKWMRSLAKIAADKEVSDFHWTSPAGDHISLLEREVILKEFRTSHLGKCTLPIGRSGPNYPAMIKALAPGFVHSLDASLLKIAFDGWKESLSCIHDCVLLHPQDVDAAMVKIRAAFQATCESDPLAQLADSMGITPEVLPRLKQGEGKLEQVHDSRYLFN
jgi:DNA-directed RNA polymerase, mitochondrial